MLTPGGLPFGSGPRKPAENPYRTIRNPGCVLCGATCNPDTAGVKVREDAHGYLARWVCPDDEGCKGKGLKLCWKCEKPVTGRYGKDYERHKEGRHQPVMWFCRPCLDSDAPISDNACLGEGPFRFPNWSES